jgi:hypothetical protein
MGKRGNSEGSIIRRKNGRVRSRGRGLYLQLVRSYREGDKV